MGGEAIAGLATQNCFSKAHSTLSDGRMASAIKRGIGIPVPRFTCVFSNVTVVVL